MREFFAHAVSEYPKEACGVLVNGQYVPCINEAEDPLRDFRISADQIVRLELKHGRIEAVLHSHPYSSASPPKWPAEWPTTMDMECWLKGSVPWGIAACDGEGCTRIVWLNEDKPEALVGREFIHGINDCYSLVRDWFKQERGITLPNYARGMEWWDKGKDLYSQNFADAGFVEISREQVQTGDCVLMQVRSPVVNHAAVITGTNLILHHLFHRLSGTDALQKWARCVNKYVRYMGDK